jgi:FkbM family methyltransferase
MRKFFAGIAKSGIRQFNVNKVLFGKNKGLKFHNNEDLNIDMILGIHEPNTFEVFDLFIKPGNTVVDIGANIGYFSRFLSMKVGTQGHVYAFEPIPTTFATLLKTIQLNGLTNVTPVNMASSDHEGTVTMYLSHTHYMASLDVKWASTAGGETQVPCTTIDAFFSSLPNKPDFIKMDIEGGGVYALKGMEQTIKSYQPVLFLESHTPEEDMAIGHALSLIQYDVYRVGDVTPVKHLDRDYRDKEGIYNTVIGVPVSKKATFGNFDPYVFQKSRFGQRS